MIAVLTGGTGGAKLIAGLATVLNPAELTIICNTGDDSIFHGLHISPDIDTIIYTLAGLSDDEKGWGIKGDTFAVLEQLRRLGNEAWFQLGDKDMATHIMRTRALREGRKLSDITAEIAQALDVGAKVLPMSDDRVQTRMRTDAGEIPFQEFFVKERGLPLVLSVSFAGVEQSQPAPGVLDTLLRAEAVVICPSNPVTSIGPILAVPKLRAALQSATAPVVAVSPLIGNTAISGPAHKLMRSCGWEPSSFGVARAYADILDIFFVAVEEQSADRIERLGIQALCTEIRMDSLADKKRLATEVLASLRK